MGFRFRKRIKIIPGVWLNLGKKGINSMSVGAGPFTSNINRDGIKHTTGLHGTGLSYETKRSAWTNSSGGMSFLTKTIYVILAILLVAFLLH